MTKKTKKIVQTFSSEKPKKSMQGEVVSNKMDKTAVVEIVRRFKHPLIGKTVKRSKKYQVHDEKNECAIGDIVEIVEVRPLSKTKHMVLKNVVVKAT